MLHSSLQYHAVVNRGYGNVRSADVNHKSGCLAGRKAFGEEAC